MEQVTKRLMNWASILEDNTLEQARRTSEMPFVFPHLALMPDAHLGKGATVGSVIPTQGAIIPAAVGVDIGCGMIAWQTEVNVTHLDGPNGGKDRRPLREAIEQVIPLSPGKYNEKLRDSHTEELVEELERLAARWPKFSPEHYARNWRLQLGSLGGGNHFIEVSVDQAGQLWLFLHSGSRGVGNRIAQYHIGEAKRQMRQYFIDLPDPDLAYLVEGTDDFWAYICQMRWAQHFAWLNRVEMMHRVYQVFCEWLDYEPEITQRVNCHHNYTEQERHFGKEVWLTRKGAISAKVGEWGLIPGSMGTQSYVVEGRGNRLALESAPHGAGRVHSRTSARRTFTQDDLREAMGSIEYRDSEAFVDEHPGAYKPIDQVMYDARDLVEVRHVLRQIVNVKGE